MPTKKIFTITIICNLILISLLAIGLIHTINIKHYKPITPEQFTEEMTKIGCNVENVKEENSKIFLTTNKETCPYSFSYTITDSQKLENLIFKETANNINIKRTTHTLITDKYMEFSTYGEKFNIMTRNENTILYASANNKYRNEILHIFDELNYHFKPNKNGIIIIGIMFILFITYISVLFYKIKNKIDNKGWIGAIPIINIFELIKDMYGSYLYNLLLLIPVINIIIFIRMFYKLSRSFQKSKKFSICSILAPTILLPFIAFDKSQYKKIEVKKIEQKQRKKINKLSILFNIINWIISIIVILLGIVFLSIYFDEKLNGYLALFLISIYYFLLFNPLIKFKSKIFTYNSKTKTILFFIGIFLIILSFTFFKF